MIDLRQGIVTMDAMGTQTDIVAEIIQGKGDYCLAVKLRFAITGFHTMSTGYQKDILSGRSYAALV